MAEEKGVLCIPASPFFSQEQAEKGASDQFVRIAFCKTDDTINAAAEKFSAMNEAILLEKGVMQNATVAVDP
jgi:kynurenine--oxoglutarate transaminase/cysteine-S-conjugate beta-lyase/glutamine--phenylpyruvate transaminase